MKFIFSSLLAMVMVCLWFSCKQEQDYKDIRSEVVAIHDKVMSDADLANSQKSVLDSIYRSFKVSGVDTVKLAETIRKVDGANQQMENWMNRFEPDVSGKSNEEALRYFKSELKKINDLDKQFKAVISRSDRYLDSLHIENRKMLH
ncbi:hypothetical protein SAMN05421827_107149 [Pedobacter terrae]|uniref:Uncharacterized protein n=1 Tax=Pedobacter terrae TaxID=405671 RepID=A0A1G7UWA1_9SPHI|nr:hypothetical protein [Pedobacter terrae]SDG51822.1 hypothetical protein SAMN05421827_107149 [Pedobacter terrae]